MNSEIGKTYNFLTIETFSGINKWRRREFLCQCRCGKKIKAELTRLKNKHTQSCGCIRDERRNAGAKQYRELRMPRGESSFNIVFYRYLSAAKKRKMSFSLSRDVFRQLTSSPCDYCGALPSQCTTQKSDKYRGKYIYSGLDRVDNSRGYDEDNVVPCCAQCNYAKCEKSREEFLEWIQRAYHQQLVKRSESRIR